MYEARDSRMILCGVATKMSATICKILKTVARGKITRCKASGRFVLIIITQWILTFLVFLPRYLEDKPFSIYGRVPPHDMLKDILISRNEEKSRKAMDYFSNRPKYQESVPNTTQLAHADLVAVIIATKRERLKKNMGFLTQTAAAFHQQFANSRNLRKQTLIVCDASSRTTDFPEARLLEAFMPVVRREKPVRNIKLKLDPYDREKEDYVFCIKTALKRAPKAQHILILEDDCLPFPSSLSILNNILDRQLRFDYIKLFYPRRWQGFGFETRPMLDLAGITVISGLILTFTYMSILSVTRKLPASRKLLLTTWMFVLGCLYGLTACLLIGRPTLMDMLRGLAPYFYRLVPAYGASTVGILYTARTAENVATFLQKTVCVSGRAVDVAINEYRNNNSLLAYSIEPDLVSHIGFYSSRKAWKADLRDFI